MGRFDSFGVVEAYHATAVAWRRAARYGDAKAIADRIAAARGPQGMCPCHNDLLNANFIADGKRIWIVDWEYAGMGDRFFDLANFSINHELGDEENHELLRFYFGDARDEHLGALLLMRFMSDFREAMWGVVQQGISGSTSTSSRTTSTSPAGPAARGRSCPPWRRCRACRGQTLDVAVPAGCAARAPAAARRDMSGV